jgi:antitoxin component YwqK of YwqJK toxin-antitoxin module
LSGDKSAEGVYADGARHGRWTFWYPDGILKMEAEYDHGMAVGTWIQYSQSGKETSRVEYGE